MFFPEPSYQDFKHRQAEIDKDRCLPFGHFLFLFTHLKFPQLLIFLWSHNSSKMSLRRNVAFIPKHHCKAGMLLSNRTVVRLCFPTITKKKQLLAYWPLWLYYPWITHPCCKIPSITIKNRSLLARTSPWPRCLCPLGVMPNHHSFAIENLWCLRDLRTKPLRKPGQHGGMHWSTSKVVSD